MKLTEEQTYQAIWEEIKFRSIKKRYQYKTYFKWWCINCGKEIFVKYDVLSLKNIFCSDNECISKMNTDSIVQIQYLRKLKEQQLNLLEKISDNNPDKYFN